VTVSVTDSGCAEWQMSSGRWTGVSGQDRGTGRRTNTGVRVVACERQTASRGRASGGTIRFLLARRGGGARPPAAGARGGGGGYWSLCLGKGSDTLVTVIAADSDVTYRSGVGGTVLLCV